MLVIGVVAVAAVAVAIFRANAPAVTETPPAVRPTATPVQSAATPASAAPTDTPPAPTATPVTRVESPPPTPSSPPAEVAPVQPAPVYTYTIVNTFPHDRDAFTQGLIYLDDIFYEGTGLHGQSSLRKVNPQTGEVLQKIDLPQEFFGEGITVFGDRLFQLTWKSRRGFVYNKNTFEKVGEFEYPTEGWGITHDGTRLIMSDGSDTLYFWDPDTLAEIGRVRVRDEHGPVVRLNELEYINGEVFANVWQTDRIARIDPETGQVVGWIVLPNLLSAADRSEPVDVLNGIAYDAATDRLFVTGKFWPKLFEIRLNLLE
ncbi:MAG: glutaminyl-peptide cyclotransferase [Chloroflexi bacterium]|nr:MAG: glutaminyl-peptide cyclotransferase [Chloroflexota bacterium]